MYRFHRVRCLAAPAASYNRPAGIERRFAPGIGLGYDVFRGEVSRLSFDAGFNRVGERFADDTRASSVYFNLAQEFKLRVNDTTDPEQRLAYSPRPETGEARSRNDFTFITGLNVAF